MCSPRDAVLASTAERTMLPVTGNSFPENKEKSQCDPHMARTFLRIA